MTTIVKHYISSLLSAQFLGLYQSNDTKLSKTKDITIEQAQRINLSFIIFLGILFTGVLISILA